MTEPAPLPRRITWFAPWTWKRRWTIVAGVVLLIFSLVLYPLSVGPAYRLYKTGGLPDPLFEIYRPLFWAALRNPFTAELLGSYLLWWDDVELPN